MGASGEDHMAITCWHTDKQYDDDTFFSSFILTTFSLKMAAALHLAGC